MDSRAKLSPRQQELWFDQASAATLPRDPRHKDFLWVGWGQASDGPTLERILCGVKRKTQLPGAWSAGAVLPTLPHTSARTRTGGPG